GVFFHPLACAIVPLTPLSQPPLDTGARFLRGARFDSPIRREPPRPLPPRRRGHGEAFPGPRRPPSTGDSPLFFRPFGRRLHTLRPQVSPSGSLLGVFSGPARAVLASNARSGSRLFVARGSSRHVWPTHREASYAARAMADATFTHDWYIRRPSPR